MDRPKRNELPSVRPTRIPAKKPRKREPVRSNLNCGALPGHVRAMPVKMNIEANRNPYPPVMYAMIGTWMEEDIIEATVKNCIANGCSKVFIVDNASPDRTRETAVAAGAIIARTYKTDYYDDDMRVLFMNECMRQITESESLPNLWWLTVDADEFPCGPHGEKLLAYVNTLSPLITCVGGNAIDLYPTDAPHYTQGMHPADCQSMGIRRGSVPGVFCQQAHWKHPLLHYEGGIFKQSQSRGLHMPFVKSVPSKPKVPAFTPHEPPESLVIFHAPYRTREHTYHRLNAMCGQQAALNGNNRGTIDDKVTQSNGSIKRWRCLDHVYAQEWDKVELPHSQIYGPSVIGIVLFAWRDLVPHIRTFPRWYAHQETKSTSLPVIS